MPEKNLGVWGKAPITIKRRRHQPIGIDNQMIRFVSTLDSPVLMPKKLLILLTWPLFHSCSSPNPIYPAFSVAGSYQLTQYHTTTKDFIASGVMTLSSVDDQHVNLVVNGSFGKTKLAYSYRNVVVSSNGRDHLGEESYRLTYKKASIGLFSSDDWGHYITLTPKPMITLVAEIPTDDL